MARKSPWPRRPSYEAATDGSDRFRYLVGEDAKAWAAMLAGMDGEQYFANISGMFGL